MLVKNERMVFLNFSKKQKIIIASVFSFLCLCGAYLLYSQQVTEDTEQMQMDLNDILNETEKEVAKLEIIDESPQIIVVDLKGAVTKPGVYKMDDGTRVIDVIKKAGGFREDADQKHVNLALYLQDEMVIYIPINGEEDFLLEQQTQAGENKNKINLNKATSDELQKIPGVGPSKAAQILAYREQNGQFKMIEDLMDVTGIGDKSFGKMKEYIYVR